jgi:hypothetical protein
VILWRALPWRARSAPSEPGGALWFPRELQGAGRHDNPDRYGCLYATEDPVSAVAECLAPFRGTGRLSTAMLTRAGLPLALAELRLASPGEACVDLDDAHVLARERLRPSQVATRSRNVTQACAAGLFDRHPQALGLRWWSTLEASLANVTLYDRAGPHLSSERVRPLTLADAHVRDAAELLGLVLTRPESARPPEPPRPARRRRGA